MWDKEGNLNGKALFVMLCCTVFTVGYIAVGAYQLIKGWMQ